MNRRQLQFFAKIALSGLIVAMPLAVGAAKLVPPTKQASASSQQALLTSLQTRAEAEIDRRVNSLTNLMNRLNTTKRLSATNKTTLQQEVQMELTDLPTLKAKIAADTDLATLRTDVQSIVTEYRVYRLIIPKVWLVAASDSILTLTDKMTTLSTALQTRINQAQQAGQTVTTLNSQITDINAKINAAKTAASTVETAVIAITPDQYDATPTLLTGKRDQLVQAVQGLQAARTEAGAIVTQLKAWETAASSTNSSASGASSQTPTSTPSQ